MKRFLWLGFVLCVYLICSGCGDTFRPIIIPNPPTFPDPKAAHTVVSINDNGTVTPGSAMVIDVSGDSAVSVADVNLAPVHAVQQTANEVLVINQAVTGLTPPSTGCLITTNNQVFNVCPSLTKLNFNSILQISSTTTITLPPSSAANFVAVAPSDTTAYVTLPSFVPDPVNFPNVVVPSVGVVSTQSNNLVATIPVGAHPDAIAVTPNKSKLYVANRDSNSISGFNILTLNLSPRTVTGSFNAPLWVIARSDGQRVYVLNGNGVVSTIDTTSTAGPDNVIDGSVNAPLAAYMLYDGHLNRLYIPGGSQLTVLNVAPSIPQVLAGSPVTIPTVPPGSRLVSDPCSGTSAQSLVVAAVAALPDGSRAYAGAYYEDTVDNVEYFCPQVTVIDVASNTIKSSIAVPGFPAYDAFCASTRFRMTMAAGGDSSRAYLASCDGGMVNIIDTSNDSYIENLLAPVGVRPPIPPNLENLPQNPVFLFAGP
jgi:DNA-binding beta-propeller fold protein YncE